MGAKEQNKSWGRFMKRTIWTLSLGRADLFGLQKEFVDKLKLTNL